LRPILKESGLSKTTVRISVWVSHRLPGRIDDGSASAAIPSSRYQRLAPPRSGYWLKQLSTRLEENLFRSPSAKPWDLYLATHCAQKNRTKTRYETERLLRKHFAAKFKERALATISSNDISTVIDGLYPVITKAIP
jgi:hypothetical protein